MSTSRAYRTLSIVMILTLMLNATPLLTTASVVAAPLKSEVKSPQAQGAAFDIRVAVRNRDGTPLRNVDITLSAYDGPYTNQASTSAHGQG